MAIALAIVLSICKPNRWKSEQMAAILFGFPMVLDKMAAILLKTEHNMQYSDPHCNSGDKNIENIY